MLTPVLAAMLVASETGAWVNPHPPVFSRVMVTRLSEGTSEKSQERTCWVPRVTATVWA
jgi:hypothetical protein